LNPKTRLDLLKEMLTKEPDDSFLNYALALELRKENKTTEAIVLLERILVKDDSYLPAYYQLGKLYGEALQKEKAKEILCKGVHIARQENDYKTVNELKELLEIINE
jgi:tetratricopeptide (TPR) repeat protein